MKKYLCLLVILTLTCLLVKAKQATDLQQTLQNMDKSFFIENKGQWHNDVLYLCRLGGLDAWITKDGVSYNFYKLEEKTSSKKNKHLFPEKFEQKEYNMIGHGIVMKLQNPNSTPTRVGFQKQDFYYNYFIGNDTSKQTTYVGLYKEAIVKNVYNGIDIRYYFDNGSLRFDYIVHPGANPQQIAFTIDGTENTFVNKKGNLVLNTRFGEIALAELKTFQANDKKVIESCFVNKEGKWTIAIGSYDPKQILIIDPLVYSTFIGGYGWDYGYDIALDGSLNSYLTGQTVSPNFPISQGAFQISGGGDYDVFVTKLNTTATAILYSTYIGGSDQEAGRSISVDASGNAYVTGGTSSSNYPVTSLAYQTINGGGGDIFVTKLNQTGTALLYSTFIGGSNSEQGLSISLDSNGNSYITGVTFSPNFPVTTGAFQITYSGEEDVFVCKLNSTGIALTYSTYIGGSGSDLGYDLAVDNSGNACVTGHTNSSNFPVTIGAFQTTYGGGDEDIFVSKFNTLGTVLLYSTYIGGNGSDKAFGIALDSNANPYITGRTNSINFPVSSSAFQQSYGGGFSDVIVAKFDSTGTSVLYSTYIGGSGSESGYDIIVDSGGNAYITGDANSGYPITAGVHQITYGGGTSDVFVTKLNATDNTLLYSTYIGGNDLDRAYGIKLDGSGNTYITGYTNSSNYPVTTNAFQTTNGGGVWTDAFVSKLCLISIFLSSSSGASNQSICINSAISNITYHTTGATGATVTGLPAGVTSSFTADSLIISGTPTVSGFFNYTVILTGGCGTINSSGTITVNICTGISENNKPKNNWKIYPIPNNGNFTFQSEQAGLFDLIDITGNVLESFIIINTTENIQISLPSGVYFIREKGSGTTQKLLVYK